MIELLVTLLVLSVVVLAATTLVTTADRVASSQIPVSELQTNHRVAQQELNRMVSLAGVGGLPEGILPALANNNPEGVFPRGLALTVTNNVVDGTRIGDNTTRRVVADTDILTVRGVFSTPVQFIEPPVPLVLVNDRIAITLNEEFDIGIAQDLEALRSALVAAQAENRPEAFIIRDRFNPGAYAVMELDHTATIPGNPGDTSLTVGLVLADAGGVQTYADEYGRLILGSTLLPGAGGNELTLPDGTIIQLPPTVGTIGLLEEYRFYVREEWEVAGDPTSRPTPVLARARFYPGTGDLHPEGSIDLADGIIDVQVALGVDLEDSDDGLVTDDGSEGDEVLYNHPDDDDGLAPPLAGTWGLRDAELSFVRLSLLAQAPRPDPVFEGVIVGVVEDHDYNDSTEPSIFNLGPNPKVRKRLLQTIVDVRNLP